MPRFEIYRSGILRREWRWRYRGRNGRIIFASSEGYRHRVDAVNAIQLTRECRSAPMVDG